MRGQNLMWLWLWATVVLGGGVQAAPTQAQPKETPARTLGLLAALDDPDNAVVTKALETLSKEQAQNNPEVRKRLQSFMRETRLGELLEDPRSNVRSLAVEALGGLGEGTKEQAPRLVELLNDPSLSVRFAAARALRGLGEGAKEQVPRLVELMKDPRPEVRRAVAQVLAALVDCPRSNST